MTIKELREKFNIELSLIFEKNEIDSFFFILIEHKLNLKKIDFLLEPEKTLSEFDIDFFNNAIKRLKKEIPVQYITGQKEFYGYDFAVNENTLIPRPETEELVDWIISDAKTLNKTLKILDIGTGSGCIAISLAKEIPNAKVTAIDISSKAIEVAKENALKNNVKINFINKSIFENIHLEDKFDIIVSNPPYVRELEKKEIKNNVLNNEPHTALFVEDDKPLIFYNKIASFAKQNLTIQGSLYFEINQYLGNEMLILLKQKGFKENTLKKDLFGNDRMTKSHFFEQTENNTN